MSTYLVYFDETGDDGITTASSDHFILTSVYMPTESWQNNFNIMRELRKELRSEFNFPIKEEMHTKHFLTDKKPYRQYKWTREQKQNILNRFVTAIAKMELHVIDVIIDKTAITTSDYNVLQTALTYNIQRIENDSKGNWNYIIITDEGRIAPMRKTARAIRTFNPIQSRFSGFVNQPIRGLVEDIIDKNSRDSYFIQICDFISYFVHLYYVSHIQQKTLPRRVLNIIDADFIINVLNSLKQEDRLNLKASSSNEYGLVIYPRK